MKATKNNIWKYLLIVLGIAFIISSFFGGREWSKRFWEREIKQRDSLIDVSQIKQDSLTLELMSFELLTDEMQITIDEKNQRNRSLYSLLKQKERENFITDTSFVRNAERIADSVDRYHTRDNNLR